MNTTVEKITGFIEKRLSAFGPMDRIQIITNIRESLDEMEKQAMTEEYNLTEDYFE